MLRVPEKDENIGETLIMESYTYNTKKISNIIISFLQLAFQIEFQLDQLSKF